ncbi:LysR family transcriptional regulator [Streptomyces sp. NPDC093085]|uniref:LysR family transcriptional regulator n=1 Tax=Streptomyces sp. NPDC093085 TaxID=3155068 RepID=UPI003445E084
MGDRTSGTAGAAADVELRQLRCLVAIIDEGSFTGAAAELGLSQPAVSRQLAALERELGVPLIRRTTRELAPTATGVRVAAHARRVLAEMADLVAEATSGHTRLRVGYAWSALGRHTVAFQRRWSATRPEVRLQLVRTNSATAGLAEGACDLAVVRRPLDGDRRFDSAIVGLERRYCALAADDPLAGRRSVRLADLADRTLLVDRRTGTTTVEMWPPESRPEVEFTQEIDDWLTVVATGRCVGVTAESTRDQYPRPGVVYRPVRDAEPIAVRLAWWQGAPHPATGAAIELLTRLYRNG